MKSLFSLLLVAALAAGCSQKSADTGSSPAPGTAAATSAATSADPGAAFLTDNGKKPGVVTTASGLQYLVVKSGSGPSPKATDTVTVNYEGKLIDGTIFDSSYQRGQPASFPVNQVIPGWTEALQLMKVGDQWQLFIPANLAYGAQSPSPTIPPNSVLIFKVELLGIQ